MSSSTVVRPAIILTVVPDEGPTARDLLRAVLLRHRFVLSSLAALLIAVAVAQIPISHDLIYHYTSHSSRTGAPPAETLTAVREKLLQLAQGLMAVSIIVIAIFGGSVLLTQDFESGTVRYTRTQAAGRRRILLATVMVFCLMIAICGSLMALTYAHGQARLQTIGQAGPWEVRVMLFSLPAYPFLLLAAFALGLIIGALFRRTIRSIAVTLVALVVLAYGLSAELFQKSTNWFDHVFITNDPSMQKVETIRAMGFSGYNAFGRSGGTLINYGCTNPGGRTIFYQNASPSTIAREHLSCFITYQPPSGVPLHQWIWVGILGVTFAVAVWGTFRVTGGRDSLWFHRRSDLSQSL
jgi:hypothetical protein